MNGRMSRAPASADGAMKFAPRESPSSQVWHGRPGARLKSTLPWLNRPEWVRSGTGFNRFPSWLAGDFNSRRSREKEWGTPLKLSIDKLVRSGYIRGTRVVNLSSKQKVRSRLRRPDWGTAQVSRGPTERVFDRSVVTPNRQSGANREAFFLGCKIAPAAGRRNKVQKG